MEKAEGHEEDLREGSSHPPAALKAQPQTPTATHLGGRRLAALFTAAPTPWGAPSILGVQVSRGRPREGASCAQADPTRAQRG